MTDSTTGGAGAAPHARPRAWWQWLLGVGLIGMAVGVMALRYVPGLAPSPKGAEAIPIQISSELKPADRIAAQPGEFAGCNVLMVTFDTTRADRFGCYGSPRAETPFTDQLARDGVLFSKAVAPAPVTLPSHASLLTGRYPYRHGGRANGLFRVDEEQDLLSERLAASGYDTAAFVSAIVLDARFGLAQGFGVYDDDLRGEKAAEWFRQPERPGDRTTERALAWLKQPREKPFFAWVHYFDPHAPHKPPGAFEARYKDNPYEGEIAFVDAQLGALLGAIEEMGLSERTLVVVTADHGEGLSQHNEWTHGCLVYDSTMRVPLVMACGRRLGGGVHVDRTVSLVDVMPTLLALLGHEKPDGMDGLDLTAAIDPNRAVYLETTEGFFEYGFAPLLAVREGGMKYIHGPDPELYDVDADPFEERNLVRSQPHKVEALRRRLTSFFGDDLFKAALASPTHQLSPEDVNRLATLGYVLGGSSTVASAESLPDPKSMMKLKQRVEATVYGEAAQPELEKLIRELDALAKDNPDVYMIHWYRGNTMHRKGDLAPAVEAFKRCLELRPNLPPALLALARAYAAQEDYTQALVHYEKLQEICPDHLGSLLEYAALLKQQGRWREAADALRRAFAIRPADETVVHEMVTTLITNGSTSEAVTALEEMLRERPSLSGARIALADLLVQVKRHGDAIAVLREGVKAAPDDLRLSNNLAGLLVTGAEAELHSPTEAALMMERICRATDYKKPEYLLTLSVVYSRTHRIDEAIAMAERAQELSQQAGQTGLTDSIAHYLTAFRQAKAQGLGTLPRPMPAALMEKQPANDKPSGE